MIVTARGTLCLAVLCLLPVTPAVAQSSVPDTNRGYAGIRSAGANNSQLLKAFGLTRGVIVAQVTKGSPAQKAGIRPDDAILAITGTPVNGPDDFTALMARMSPGTLVIFTLDRNGESLLVPVKLVSFAEAFPGNPGGVSAETQTASTGLQFGMKIRDLPEADRIARHLEGDEGMEVVSVDNDSFAGEIGLQARDVILSINRHPVRSAEEFLGHKTSIRYGDAVALRVARFAAGEAGKGTEAGWRMILLSGNAPTAAEAERKSSEKAQRAAEVVPTTLQLPQVSRPPGIRQRLLGAVLSGLQNPQGQVQPMGGGRCSIAQLMGEWGGVEVTGRFQAIDVSFRINPDGTYNYFAGQGNAPWIRHSGVFQLSDNPDQRYPCRITFNPDPSTIQVASTAHLFVVQSRDLLDDQPRTFLYKFFPNATHLMLAGTWTDWRNDVGTVGLDRR